MATCNGSFQMVGNGWVTSASSLTLLTSIDHAMHHKISSAIISCISAGVNLDTPQLRLKSSCGLNEASKNFSVLGFQ